MFELADFLKNEYHITPTAVTLLQEGSDNDVYKITTAENQAFVLRISKRANKNEDIAFELDFISFLHRHNMPVPQVIQTIHNQYYALINHRPACLFSFCAGSVFKLSEQNKPSLQMATNGGRILAQLHHVSAAYCAQKELTTSRCVFSEVNRVLQQKELFCQKYIAGDLFINDIEQILRDVQPLVTNETIIHNDFRIQNLLFDGNDVTTVLDFDWACVGAGLKDLGHALIEWSFPDRADGCQWDILKAFLKGYQEICPQIDYQNLLTWMRFSCLSDASTYLADTINLGEKPRAINSYMYQKYTFLKTVRAEKLIPVSA